MKRSIGVPILGVCAGLCCVDNAIAQEPAPAALPIVEIFGCNYNGTNDMDDLLAVTARWNAWANRNNVTDYTAVVLSPYLHSEELTFDVLWLGVWPNGAAMGAGEALWLAQGQELIAAFDEVADCAIHTQFASFNIRTPADPPPDDPIVRFMDCTLHADRIVLEAISALRQWTDYLAGQGTDMFGAMMYALAGESMEAGYTFKWVEGFDSFEAYGKFLDTFTGGGFQRANELFGRVMDCDSPRVYLANRVRSAAE